MFIPAWTQPSTENVFKYDNNFHGWACLHLKRQRVLLQMSMPWCGIMQTSIHSSIIIPLSMSPMHYCQYFDHRPIQCACFFLIMAHFLVMAHHNLCRDMTSCLWQNNHHKVTNGTATKIIKLKTEQQSQFQLWNNNHKFSTGTTVTNWNSNQKANPQVWIRIQLP